jgi:hypothetical protein
MKAIGNPVDRTSSKEKPLPNWVINLMNNYFEENKNDYKDSDEYGFSFMSVNFFGQYISKRYPDHRLWEGTVEVCGKNIPVYQQYMINDYLVMRLKQYYTR